MAGLEEHFLLEATTLSEGGVTLGQGSPFLVILVSSRCLSSGTLSASYRVDLGGLAFLWL